MARYEAKDFDDENSMLLLLRYSGTVVGGWQTGSGRKVPRSVTSKARRLLKEMMPDLFPKRSRTSTRRRRTSRAPKKKRRRTSRRLG